MDRRSCRAAWALVLVTFAGVPALAGPTVPGPRPSRPPNPQPPAFVAVPSEPPAGAALYARRARRLVQSYLRLKLLELREIDLERARAVIERRLGPQALLDTGPLPPRPSAGSGLPPVPPGIRL
jgi:hypothetical protein